jgi:hypothetical protein
LRGPDRDICSIQCKIAPFAPISISFASVKCRRKENAVFSSRNNEFANIEKNSATDWQKNPGIEYNGEDELHEVVDEILTSISIETIKTVFVNSMDRLQRLIDGNGNYVS